jgi:hypothetical protein
LLQPITVDELAVVLDIAVILLTDVRPKLVQVSYSLFYIYLYQYIIYLQAEMSRERQELYRRVELVLRNVHSYITHGACLNAMYTLASLVPDTQCKYASRLIIKQVRVGMISLYFVLFAGSHWYGY